jgi:tetratricopeptide (TPR) repeat protein
MSQAEQWWALYQEGRRDMMGGAGVAAAIPKLERAFEGLARAGDGREWGVLHDLTQALLVAGRNDDASRCAHLLVAIGQQNLEPSIESAGLLLLGTLAQRADRDEEALRMYQQAELFATMARDDLGRANAAKSRGDVMVRQRCYEEALQVYAEAEQFAKKEGHDGARANIIRRRGEVLLRLGRYEEALQFFEEAERLAMKMSDVLGRANAKKSCGDALFRLSRDEEALRAYEQSEQLATVGYYEARVNAAQNRGDVLFRLRGCLREKSEVFTPAAAA